MSGQTVSAEQPASAEQSAFATCLMSQPDGAEQSAAPIFEVAFKQGMWWSIPADMSQRMYENYKNNEDVGYTWDWGNSRYGSWAPEGELTSINRYVIDFNRWGQRNLDNDRRRSVRLVWVPADRVDPIWTGEIPDTRVTRRRE